MSDLRKAAQAVLDRWDGPKWDWLDAGPTADLMKDLRAALAEPTVPSDCPNSHQPLAWMDEEINCAYTPEELNGGSTDGLLPLYAAPPQRHVKAPCRYPDCVDNGPEGKCTRWLLGECEKSEDFRGER